MQVRDDKLSWEASSKVGSLDNVKHTAGGGKVQVRTQHVCVMSSVYVGGLHFLVQFSSLHSLVYIL